MADFSKVIGRLTRGLLTITRTFIYRKEWSVIVPLNIEKNINYVRYNNNGEGDIYLCC